MNCNVGVTNVGPVGLVLAVLGDQCRTGTCSVANVGLVLAVLGSPM